MISTQIQGAPLRCLGMPDPETYDPIKKGLSAEQLKALNIKQCG
jgi:hypothetical protein